MMTREILGTEWLHAVFRISFSHSRLWNCIWLHATVWGCWNQLLVSVLTAGRTGAPDREPLAALKAKGVVGAEGAHGPLSLKDFKKPRLPPCLSTALYHTDFCFVLTGVSQLWFLRVISTHFSLPMVSLFPAYCLRWCWPCPHFPLGRMQQAGK